MRRPLRTASLLVLGLLATVLAAPAPAAPTWLPVTPLSVSGSSDQAARVAIDGAGNATAVWHDNLTVHWSSHPAGGTWSPHAPLSAPGVDSLFPEIVVTPAGAATVVWTRDDPSGLVLQFATRQGGGAWSAPADVFTSLRLAGEFAVATDPAGTVTVVYLHPTGGSSSTVEVTSRPVGGAWSEPFELAAAAFHEQPVVVADPSGRVTAPLGSRRGRAVPAAPGRRFLVGDGAGRGRPVAGPRRRRGGERHRGLAGAGRRHLDELDAARGHVVADATAHRRQPGRRQPAGHRRGVRGNHGDLVELRDRYVRAASGVPAPGRGLRARRRAAHLGQGGGRSGRRGRGRRVRRGLGRGQHAGRLHGVRRPVHRRVVAGHAAAATPRLRGQGGRAPNGDAVAVLPGSRRPAGRSRRLPWTSADRPSPPSPLRVQEPRTSSLTYSAGAIDAWSAVASYSWSFGDGTSAPDRR